MKSALPSLLVVIFLSLFFSQTVDIRANDSLEHTILVECAFEKDVNDIIDKNLFLPLIIFQSFGMELFHEKKTIAEVQLKNQTPHSGHVPIYLDQQVFII